ncbi:hypothetical protein LCGC14_1197960 [marine sediment metagenome]|uniref:Uncharacterized protein n=1 Tax=marine sediment metagenome TaxID=412755 RepID=A0A0F9P085_9ZZZZ
MSKKIYINFFRVLLNQYYGKFKLKQLTDELKINYKLKFSIF